MAALQHDERDGLITVDLAGCPIIEDLQQFRYSKAYSPHAAALQLQQQGCSCDGNCTQLECSCVKECTKGLQSLQAHGRAAGLISLLECGPACCCGADCPARMTQQGLAVKLLLRWIPSKGWGVFAGERISQGAFVCQYVGEYVSVAEARQRLSSYDQDTGRGHALLTVRLQLPSQSSSLLSCIDATKTGNIARFINHSCDGGNLEAVLVTTRGCLLPQVALFAAHHIPEGQELSYAYCQVERPEDSDVQSREDAEQQRPQPASSRRPCCCGTAACTGYLPSAL